MLLVLSSQIRRQYCSSGIIPSLFRRGRIIPYLKPGGTLDSVRDELIIFFIPGRSSDTHSFSRLVGIGSSIEYFDGDVMMRVCTPCTCPYSSKVRQGGWVGFTLGPLPCSDSGVSDFLCLLEYYRPCPQKSLSIST